MDNSLDSVFINLRLLDFIFMMNSFLNLFNSAYHGHVISLIDISPYKFNHKGGEGKPDWVHVVSNSFIATFYVKITSFKTIIHEFILF